MRASRARSERRWRTRCRAGPARVARRHAWRATRSWWRSRPARPWPDARWSPQGGRPRGGTRSTASAPRRPARVGPVDPESGGWAQKTSWVRREVCLELSVGRARAAIRIGDAPPVLLLLLIPARVRNVNDGHEAHPRLPQLVRALERCDELLALLIAVHREPGVRRAAANVGRGAHLEHRDLLVAVALLDHQ